MTFNEQTPWDLAFQTENRAFSNDFARLNPTNLSG